MHAHAPPGAPPCTIAAIFRTHGGSFRQTPSPLARAGPGIWAISNTAAPRPRRPSLPLPDSARPRCPSTTPASTATVRPARGPAQLRGSAERKQRLLPTDYFHVVFTLPALLRPLARRYRRLLFDLLFAAAAETLLTFGRDPKRLGAELGFTLVLHTWTRDLSFHPHVHAIVTGGGLDVRRRSLGKRTPGLPLPRPSALAPFPRQVPRRAHRALRAGHLQRFPARPHSFRTLTRRLARQPWVVYAKKPFGRCAPKLQRRGVAPSRSSPTSAATPIASPSPTAACSRSPTTLVTFRTRGEGSCTIAPHEFIRRFLLHVLPEQLVKIRHYGLLAPANVNTRLRRAAELLAEQRNAAPSSIDSSHGSADDSAHNGEPPPDLARPRCPHCGARTLIPVGIRRSGYRRSRFNTPLPDT